MTGYEYEEKCAKLLKAKGFTDVKVTPGSGDQGIDVLAMKNGKKYGVQCKYYEGTVGNKAVQEAFAGASFYDCAVAMVITNSTLTEPAKKLAEKLGVEVWEGIDAIYLRKNDADYQKKEKARQKREAAAQKKHEAEEKQKKLDAFQQWQTTYKAVMTEREESICAEMEPLEQKYSERKNELSLRCEALCDDLSARIAELTAELKETGAKLSAASWFQITQKMQVKKRIGEAEAEIYRITREISKAREILDEELKGIGQEYQSELEQTRKSVEENIPLPSCPEVVVPIKECLLHDMIWEQAVAPTKNLVSLRLGNEDLKRLILAELWEHGSVAALGLLWDRTLYPAYPAFELSFVEQRLLAELENEGKIKKSGSTYNETYTLIDYSIISEAEKEVYAILAEYAAEEIEKVITDGKKKRVFRYTLYNREKLQEEICAFIKKKGIVYMDEVRHISLQNISEFVISEVVQDLKKSGKIYFGLGGWRGTWCYRLTQKAET